MNENDGETVVLTTETVVRVIKETVEKVNEASNWDFAFSVLVGLVIGGVIGLIIFWLTDY